MSESVMPEAVIVRTEGSRFGNGCVVTLAKAGIGWTCQDIDGAHWVPWSLLGGLSDSSVGGSWATDALALDGSPLGSILGLVAVDGVRTTLAHVVATFRPDLFVEMDSGCIRREAAEAEA